MFNFLLISLCKIISKISKTFNLGNGSTWPGHIALLMNQNFIRDVRDNSKLKIILIAGTNGKTTTARMITTILQKNHKSVFQNTSGANLLNGVASALLMNTNILGKHTKEYAIFEVDENALPLILKEITPHVVILLNLFRDQLDRYGEIDTIAKKWKSSLEQLPSSIKVYLNADDPQICFLGENLTTSVKYFGLTEKNSNKVLQHASDSIYCPRCHTKLTYKTIYYSHLGNWFCPSCKLKRPEITLSSSYYPLDGLYNQYNTLAAVLFAQQEGLNEQHIDKALQTVTPAFGRQEIVEIDGKKVQVFLSKNPTSFNQSLATIFNTQEKKILIFVLNDRIPDGRDVSWIWDIDIEEYINKIKTVIVTGDRVYDMALRLQYANVDQKLKIYEDIEQAIKESLNLLKAEDVLYILPTYSAMLEVRKILTGKKIL